MMNELAHFIWSVKVAAGYEVKFGIEACWLCLGRGFGTVGRAFTSETKDTQFESYHLLY